MRSEQNRKIRSCIARTLHKIKDDDEMGREYNMHEKKHIQIFWLDKQKGKAQLQDVGINGRIPDTKMDHEEVWQEYID
jgi:hypothetical protein